jgi:glutathione S-transferase
VYERLGHLLPNGSAPDEERVATLVEKLETKLAAYEAMLGKHKYLAGDDLTLADLFHLPWGAFAAPQEFTWFEDKEKYPNLSRYVFQVLARECVTLIVHRWWADISSRKSWKEVQRLAHMSSPMYGAMMKPRSQT